MPQIRVCRAGLGGNAQRLFNLDPVYSPTKIERRNRSIAEPGTTQRGSALAGA
jgi:hypothetical protein